MPNAPVSQLLSRARASEQAEDFDTAVSLLAEVIQRTQDNLRDQETTDLRLQALADAGRLLIKLGRYQEGLELSQQYELEAPDYQHRHMALLRIGAHAYHLGENQLAMKAYRSVVELAEEEGNERGYAAGISSLASVMASSGQMYEAINHFQKAIELFAGLEDVEGQAGAWNRLGLVFQHLGRLSDAIDAHERYLQFVEGFGADNAYLRITALNNLGEDYLFLYDWKTAQEYFRRATAVSGPPSASDIDADLHRNRGVAFWLQGNQALGLELMREALKLADQSREAGIIAQALYSLALAELDAGETEAGYEHARRLLAVAGKARARHRYAAALHALGRYHEKNSEHALALEQYQQAAALAEEVNHRLLLWQIHVDLAGIALTSSSGAHNWKKAAQIIHEIGDRITDPALRRTFFAADPVQIVLQHESN